MDFAVPADHRVEWKGSEKKGKYQHRAWEYKTTEYENHGTPRTATKRLVKGLEDLGIRGRVETIKTTSLLRSARIWRRVQETLGDLLLRLE